MPSKPTCQDRLSSAWAACAAIVLLSLSGCGSDAATDAPLTRALNAQVCTEGEARDTVLFVRNLDDSDWTNASITVVKGDLEYSLEIATFPPESVQAAQPFTVAWDFSFDDPGGSSPSGVTGEQVHERRPLHNFANLTSTRIVVATPQAAEWSGDVQPCE